MGLGATGRDWVELTQYYFQYSVSIRFLQVGGPLVYQGFFTVKCYPQ